MLDEDADMVKDARLVGAGGQLIDGYQAWLYWGGSGDTKQANDWTRLSEFYISGKN